MGLSVADTSVADTKPLRRRLYEAQSQTPSPCAGVSTESADNFTFSSPASQTPSLCAGVFTRRPMNYVSEDTKNRGRPSRKTALRERPYPRQDGAPGGGVADTKPLRRRLYHRAVRDGVGVAIPRRRHQASAQASLPAGVSTQRPRLVSSQTPSLCAGVSTMLKLRFARFAVVRSQTPSLCAGVFTWRRRVPRGQGCRRRRHQASAQAFLLGAHRTPPTAPTPRRRHQASAQAFLHFSKNVKERLRLTPWSASEPLFSFASPRDGAGTLRIP